MGRGAASKSFHMEGTVRLTALRSNQQGWRAERQQPGSGAGQLGGWWLPLQAAVGGLSKEKWKHGQEGVLKDPSQLEQRQVVHREGVQSECRDHRRLAEGAHEPSGESRNGEKYMVDRYESYTKR